MNIRERIKQKPLLFDGAMGTWYASAYQQPQGTCELANLSAPDRIRAIHEDYIKAGAGAIRTNTFGAYPEYLLQADQETVVRAGFRIAQEAAQQSDRPVFVFADIGPAAGVLTEEIVEKYREIVHIFLDCGAKFFLFETLGSDTGILEAAAEIRAKVPDAYIIVSFGVQPDGFTRDGIFYRKLLHRMEESGLVDAAGLNCVSGARHMAELMEHAGIRSIPLCALPNVGYPVVRGNRTYYDGDPEYFASQIRTLTGMGVSIIGGCCGTTPGHIRYLYRDLEHIPQPELIRYTGRKALVSEISAEDQKEAPVSEDRLFSKLSAGKPVIAVELDSPKNSDVAKFMKGAQELKNAGADALTIADCPVARARMDSSILACKVRRELDMDVIPHMTCRDRNINATKALLLGILSEGVQNVLVVTGDPIPTSERNEVRTVYQFNAVKLASYIQSLNEEVFNKPIHVFGALNVNARNIEPELEKCRKKKQAGMYGLLTQPVLTKQALENLKRAREELDMKILGGIIPVVSEKNALFMESEVNGIRVSEKIIRMYQGKSREEGEELAYEISCEIARKIRPYIDGFYLMTPFSRTGLMSRIIRSIREMY